TSQVTVDGKTETRICGKLFDNRAFGYLKITVKRALRLNFQATEERIARLRQQSAFATLPAAKNARTPLRSKPRSPLVRRNSSRSLKHCTRSTQPRSIKPAPNLSVC
ncbi:MAG: hypothetical protein M3Q45_11680, partial [Chloroflexota bacterium]|nr:hypothetical protein [Chloroflexota bacterium]